MAERNSILLGIGIGCLIVIAGGLALVGGCSYWLYREARQMEQDMENPDIRRDRARELLGVESLPEGYYPVAAFSVPFLLRAVILSDVPLEAGRTEGRPFDERGFIFVETLGLGQDEQQLRDFFEGRTDDPSVLENNGFDIDVDEELGRGTLPSEAGADLMYITQRARVGMRGYRARGISALVLVDCPDDARRRIAIWFGPDPDPESDPAALDLSGTPGDPEAIRAFLRGFRLCPRAAR